jgi:hypothetical protein
MLKDYGSEYDLLNAAPALAPRFKIKRHRG